MFSFLVPFATPIFIIGLVLTAAIVLAGVISIVNRGDESPGSLMYAVLDARIKWLIKMLGVTVVAVLIGWGLPSTDPQAVVKPKIVYVQPKPVELYDACLKHIQEDDASRASCLASARAQMELVKRYTPAETVHTVYLVPRLPDMYKKCMESYSFVDGEGNSAVMDRMKTCTDTATKQYNTMINKYKER